MNAFYYIGLDIHKKVISYCIKALDGRLIGQGKIDADRKALGEWVQGLPGCPLFLFSMSPFPPFFPNHVGQIECRCRIKFPRRST